MDYRAFAQSIRKLFMLKHTLFSGFDSSPENRGLNKTQERVLMMAWHHEGVPMRFLSRQAGMEKGSLTTVIDSLEAKGFVRRMQDTEDKRSFIIHATDEGALLAKDIERRFLNHLEQLLSPLTETQKEEFKTAADAIGKYLSILGE